MLTNAKLTLAALALSISGSALAHGPRHFNHGPVHRIHNWHWVAPTIIGGVIGYEIARANTPVIVNLPPVMAQSIPQMLTPQTSNCVLNVFNPYTQRNENVVVNCANPQQ